jgi:hypothetical protein
MEYRKAEKMRLKPLLLLNSLTGSVMERCWKLSHWSLCLAAAPGGMKSPQRGGCGDLPEYGQIAAGLPRTIHYFFTLWYKRNT